MSASALARLCHKLESPELPLPLAGEGRGGGSGRRNFTAPQLILPDQVRTDYLVTNVPSLGDLLGMVILRRRNVRSLPSLEEASDGQVRHLWSGRRPPPRPSPASGRGGFPSGRS